MRHTSSHTNQGSHTLLVFLAGAAITAAVAGYFLYGPSGQKNREKLSRWMLRAKREILSKMETAGELTEDRYHTIVDEVTDRYAQMKHIGQEKASQAATTFKQKWEDMRDLVSEAREEAEQEIRQKEQRNGTPSSGMQK